MKLDELLEQINNFLTEEGKLKILPAKYSKKLLVYEYLGTKFEDGKEYTEQEVNIIIGSWHTFTDVSTLRRGLIDSQQLIRDRSGRIYQKKSK